MVLKRERRKWCCKKRDENGIEKRNEENGVEKRDIERKMLRERGKRDRGK